MKNVVRIPFKVNDTNGPNDYFEGILKWRVDSDFAHAIRTGAELLLEHCWGDGVDQVQIVICEIDKTFLYADSDQISIWCKDVVFLGDLANVKELAVKCGFEIVENDGNER